MSDLDLNFGGLESMLALVHDIADSKRTAFQARLKNLHRLSFPIGFESQKGKASVYHPGHIVEMALAIEMTQLGLPPERTVHVLAMNRFPTFMALRMAATALTKSPSGFDAHKELETDPLSMFLFFDPAALSPLMLDNPQLTPDIDFADDTFFYGGAGIVRENIVAWTSGNINRLSLINVTSMIDMVADARAVHLHEEQEILDLKRRFFEAVEVWSDDQVEKTYSEEAVHFATKALKHSSFNDLLNDDSNVAILAEKTGLLPETIFSALAKLMEEERPDDSNP